MIWAQSEPHLDMEPVEVTPLEFMYFMLMFHESLEKVDDLGGMLTWLIKYAQRGPQELVKHFINDRADFD